MTSVPARRFGLKGRGVIEKGAFADIAVWKEDEFKSNSTYSSPHCFTEGVKAVIVNGTLSRLGDSSCANAGRFIER
jgi:N-acyl-D-amino-acid deacylase